MIRKTISQIGLVAGLFLASCGANQQQVVKSFSYNILNNILSFDVEFNQNVELNTAFTLPILDYGSITLSPPATGKGFIIGGSLNLNYVNDEHLLTISRTNQLPNGQSMPTYVIDNLARLHFTESSMVSTDAYLGMNSNNMYVGAALELGYIDQHFPAGLVLSAYITDSQQRRLGVITIFGPNVQNGQLVNPGGIFFVTNISDLIKFYPKGMNIRPSAIQDMQSYKNLVEINPRYRKHYSDPFKLQTLFDQLRKAGEDAGYIDLK